MPSLDYGFIPKARRDLWQIIKSFRDLAFSPRDSWRQAGTADILFFSSDANKALVLGNQAFDRVMDPLSDCFKDAGFSTLSVAYPGSKTVGRLTSASSLSFTRLVTSEVIRSQIRGAWQSISRANNATRSSARENAYIKLFRRLQPRLIFVTNAKPDMCAVAGRLKIPVLEVLHARGYGEIYEGWKTRHISQLPDGVIAYDDVSAKTFGRVIPVLKVPNFRFAFELELAERAREVAPSTVSGLTNRYKYRVLFTVSYDPERRYWPGGLPEALVELIRRDRNMFLFVRLHPVMLVGEKFAEARRAIFELVKDCANCDLEWASNAPLYSVLQASTVHLTFDSMSAYEASDLGIPTYAIDDGKNIVGPRMKDLRDSGLLMNVKTNRESLEQVIKSPKPRSPRQPNPPELQLSQIIRFAERSSRARWSQIIKD